MWSVAQLGHLAEFWCNNPQLRWVQLACRWGECVAFILFFFFFFLSPSLWLIRWLAGKLSSCPVIPWKSSDTSRYSCKEKTTTLPEKLPKTSVRLKTCQKKRSERNCCHFFTFHPAVFFICLFVFCLASEMIYDTAMFWRFFIFFVFGDRLSWVLESHRLEMSKCKAVIDPWEAMQSPPGWFFCFFLFVFGVFFPVNVQFFFPYRAITIAKEWF